VDLPTGQSEGLDSLVDRDDLVERWPGKDAERVVNVGRSPHTVQHAADTRGAGQYPEGLAREAISISLGRIIHIEVNNLPSGLRLRPAFAGRRSGLALSRPRERPVETCRCG